MNRMIHVAASHAKDGHAHRAARLWRRRQERVGEGQGQGQGQGEGEGRAAGTIFSRTLRRRGALPLLETVAAPPADPHRLDEHSVPTRSRQPSRLRPRPSGAEGLRFRRSGASPEQRRRGAVGRPCRRQALPPGPTNTSLSLFFLSIPFLYLSISFLSL